MKWEKEARKVRFNLKITRAILVHCTMVILCSPLALVLQAMLRATAGAVMRSASNEEDSGTDTSSVHSGTSDGDQNLIYRESGRVHQEDEEGGYIGHLRF